MNLVTSVPKSLIYVEKMENQVIFWKKLGECLQFFQNSDHFLQNSDHFFAKLTSILGKLSSENAKTQFFRNFNGVDVGTSV